MYVQSLVYFTNAYFMPKKAFFLVYEAFGLLEKNLSQNAKIYPSKSHFCPVNDVQSCWNFVQASFMPPYALVLSFNSIWYLDNFLSQNDPQKSQIFGIAPGNLILFAGTIVGPLNSHKKFQVNRTTPWPTFAYL